MDPNRRAAYGALRDIESKGAYSNYAVNRHVQNAQVRSPAFVRGLVYGVLRHTYFLDYNIDRLLREPSRRVKPGVRTLLRMAMYQLLFMDSVSDYAAVDETVGMAAALFRGQQGFVNGVLRAFVRTGRQTVLPDPSDVVEHDSIRYSTHPDIVRLWHEAYGPAIARKLLESTLEIPPLTLRTNALVNTRADLIKKLSDAGLDPAAGRLAETAITLSGGEVLAGDLYRNGCFSIQDESSQVALDILNPKPGEYLLDLCAAPGGKSCAAAERMQDLGTVQAFDIHEGKIQSILDEATRLGLTSISARARDSTVPDTSLVSLADCVWLDAPCSGLGVLRRKPEIKLKSCAQTMRTLKTLQQKLLATAAAYPGPEGRLMYTTCTINPAENEEMTRAFRRSNPEYRLERELQLTPHEHGTDGFYICLMRRQHD